MTTVQPAARGLQRDPADPGEGVQQPPRPGRGDQVDQQPGVAHGQAAAAQGGAVAAVAAHLPDRPAARLEQEHAPVRGPLAVAGRVLGVQPLQPPSAAAASGRRPPRAGPAPTSRSTAVL